MTILSVVIPAYNEESGIADIVHRVLSIKDSLLNVGIDSLDLLVVDDGSRDRTAQIAGQITGVRLISHPKNRGYGAALKTGFAMSKGNLIGFLDADGTYPPEFFPQLCVQAMNGSDLVVGSRRSGAISQMPFVRRLGNMIWSNLVTLLGSQRVVDPASGMRVFKREILEKIYPLPDGLNLTPVMSARAVHEHIRLAEIPVPYRERVGRSKLSVVRDGTTFLQSIIWTVLAYNPVRVLGLLGLVGLGFAGLVAVSLVVARLSGVTTLGPWGVAALFWALVSAVTGTSLFALGATFNSLVSLFYKRPIRQGLFSRPLFQKPVEQYFIWIGAVLLVIGVAIATVSVVLGVNGWEITRLWLYLLGSALFILTGVQMMVFWVIERVLNELNQREMLIHSDLGGN